MLITAYVDESGTHGSETMLMSVLLGNTDQWDRFMADMKTLFRQFGIRRFHATDLRHGKGEFAGWTVNKKARFVDEFAALPNNLEHQAAVSLKMSAYEEHYLGAKEGRPKRLLSAYGICFLGVLQFAIPKFMSHHSREWRGKFVNRKFDLVLEGGHRNAGDVLRIWNDFESRLVPDSRKYWGKLTFAAKDGCPELAAADFIAYTMWGLAEGRKGAWDYRRPRKSDQTYRKNFHQVRISAQTLQSLRKV